MMRMAATTAVVAGTATAVSGHVARKQDAKAQQAAESQAYQQQQMAPPPMAPAPAPAPAAGGLSQDAINELQQLAGLRDQGILTDDEFNAQKAKLLGS